MKGKFTVRVLCALGPRCMELKNSVLCQKRGVCVCDVWVVEEGDISIMRTERFGKGRIHFS